MGVTLIAYGGRGREGEERNFRLKTRLVTFLEIKFFCVTLWLNLTPNKCENCFLYIFSKILRGSWEEIERIFVLQQS